MPLASVIGESDVVISHAGLGTTAAALMAGKPMLQLQLPRHSEQALVRRRLEALGAGLTVGELDETERFYGEMIWALLSEPTYAEKARAFAAKYAGATSEANARAVALRCDALLAGGS
jgi:glycosyltransferase